MTIHPINDAQHWRKRAEEMRGKEAKAKMFRIASDYDVLADRAEKRARGGKPSA
jgi:hypothetical protein